MVWLTGAVLLLLLALLLRDLNHSFKAQQHWKTANVARVGCLIVIV
jgi:hypothetical protein